MDDFNEFMAMMGNTETTKPTVPEESYEPTDEEEGVVKYSEDDEFGDWMQMMTGDKKNEKEEPAKDEETEEEDDIESEEDSDDDSEEDVDAEESEPEVLDLADFEGLDEDSTIITADGKEFRLGDIENVLADKEEVSELKEKLLEQDDVLTSELERIKDLHLEQDITLTTALQSFNIDALRLQKRQLAAQGQSTAEIDSKIAQYDSLSQAQQDVKAKIQKAKDIESEHREQELAKAMIKTNAELAKSWRKEFGTAWGGSNQQVDLFKFATNNLGIPEEAAKYFVNPEAMKVLQRMKNDQETRAKIDSNVKKRVNKAVKKTSSKSKSASPVAKRANTSYTSEDQEYEFFKTLM